MSFSAHASGPLLPPAPASVDGGTSGLQCVVTNTRGNNQMQGLDDLDNEFEFSSADQGTIADDPEHGYTWIFFGDSGDAECPATAGGPSGRASCHGDAWAASRGANGMGFLKGSDYGKPWSLCSNLGMVTEPYDYHSTPGLPGDLVTATGGAVFAPDLMSAPAGQPFNQYLYQSPEYSLWSAPGPNGLAPVPQPASSSAISGTNEGPASAFYYNGSVYLFYVGSPGLGLNYDCSLGLPVKSVSFLSQWKDPLASASPAPPAGTPFSPMAPPDYQILSQVDFSVDNYTGSAVQSAFGSNPSTGATSYENVRGCLLDASICSAWCGSGQVSCAQCSPSLVLDQASTGPTALTRCAPLTQVSGQSGLVWADGFNAAGQPICCSGPSCKGTNATPPATYPWPAAPAGWAQSGVVAQSGPSRSEGALAGNFIWIKGIDGGDGYLYLLASGKYRESPLYLARMPFVYGNQTFPSYLATTNLADFAGLEFFNNQLAASCPNCWQPLAGYLANPSSAQLLFSDNNNSGLGEIDVRYYDSVGVWLMSYSAVGGAGSGGQNVWMRWATSLTGPWAPIGASGGAPAGVVLDLTDSTAGRFNQCLYCRDATAKIPNSSQVCTASQGFAPVSGTEYYSWAGRVWAFTDCTPNETIYSADLLPYLTDVSPSYANGQFSTEFNAWYLLSTFRPYDSVLFWAPLSVTYPPGTLPHYGLRTFNGIAQAGRQLCMASQKGKLHSVPCNGDAAQEFVFRPKGSGTTNWFALSPISQPHRCVTVPHGHFTAGTPVDLETCNGSADQTWQVFDRVTSAGNSSYCLDVKNGSTASGAELVISTCSSLDPQVAYLEEAFQPFHY